MERFDLNLRRMKFFLSLSTFEAETLEAWLDSIYVEPWSYVLSIFWLLI